MPYYRLVAIAPRYHKAAMQPLEGRFKELAARLNVIVRAKVPDAKGVPLLLSQWKYKYAGG